MTSTTVMVAKVSRPASRRESVGLLQRKCACGASAGVSGKCESCSGKRLVRQSFDLQPNLRIGPPGDRYEREADRVANQVMRKPETAVQRQVAEEEEEELLQTKPRVQRQAVTEAPDQEVSPLVHEVLLTPGRALDSAVRRYFEPRFGHDFSQVRVHTDAKAAQSARAVNAVAYTVGQDMIYDAGAYQPCTQTGRSLIAHELVHTIQQSTGRSGGTGSGVETSPSGRGVAQPRAIALPTAKHFFVNVLGRAGVMEEERDESNSQPSVPVMRMAAGARRLQRRARALWPVDRWENPAARITGGEPPAETALEMNGRLITDSTILDASIPTPSVVGRPTPGGGFECRFDNSIDLTCRNRRIMPWADVAGAWWSRIPVESLRNAGFSQCNGVSAPGGVRFKLTATPSAQALTRRIIFSEYQHVMDTFETFRTHLVPLHDLYAQHAASLTTGEDSTSCAQTLLGSVDRYRWINEFLRDYRARQAVHDGPGGDHTTDAPMNVNSRCTLAHAEARVVTG